MIRFIYFCQMHFLTDKIEFPPIETANEFGMVAIGGDLSPERLIHAYKNGIFPWYSESEPIVWYSPNPRMVLFPKRLKISKSMKQILKKNAFKVTFNKAFKEVISNCKNISRTAQGESGTWITDEMKQAYIKLHELGIAKSVEVWSLDLEHSRSDKANYKLVGGLYGLEIGNIFCGESMFSKVSNASKAAFIHLVTSTRYPSGPLSNQFTSNYQLIDCQIYNDHLASLGAEEISREDFKKWL